MGHFKGKFTWGTDDAPTQYYEQQRHAGPMVPYRDDGRMTLQSMLPARREYQAGDERYVETVSYARTTTNDSSVSLQGAANAQARGGNSTTLNLLVGLVFALVAGKVFLPLLEKALVGVFSIIVLAAFAVGFWMFRGQIVGKGGGGGAR